LGWNVWGHAAEVGEQGDRN